MHVVDQSHSFEVSARSVEADQSHPGARPLSNGVPEGARLLATPGKRYLGNSSRRFVTRSLKSSIDITTSPCLRWTLASNQRLPQRLSHPPNPSLTGVAAITMAYITGVPTRAPTKAAPNRVRPRAVRARKFHHPQVRLQNTQRLPLVNSCALL